MRTEDGRGLTRSAGRVSRGAGRTGCSSGQTVRGSGCSLENGAERIARDAWRARRGVGILARVAGWTMRRGSERMAPRELLVAGAGLEMRVLVLNSFFLRLRGLLGTVRTDARARPVLIAPCSSIHTCGMRYSIDVAMADARGEVICSERNLSPWRFVSNGAAAYVLERPSSTDPWPDVGEVLSLRDE